MKKLLITISLSILSAGTWANPTYDYCNTIDLNELDNIERSECSGLLKNTHQNTMNQLFQKIVSSKSINPQDKKIIQESQKAFVNYKDKQCSLFTNNGASAEGLINKEFCEAGLIEQRNQILETMVD
jgi:uncharacterized protein YecT (DUF1311 family)